VVGVYLDPELAVLGQRGAARVLGADQQRLAGRSGVIEDQLLVDVEGLRAVRTQVDTTARVGESTEALFHSEERVITTLHLTPLLASAASAP
jgi:hypothetical protein